MTSWHVLGAGWVAMCFGAGCARVVPSDEMVVRACLAQLVMNFEEVPRTDAEPDQGGQAGQAGPVTLSCANPYGFAACTTAWQAARKTGAESDMQTAIAVCAPGLCAGLEAPRPRLCDEPVGTIPPSFVGFMMWQELHRVVLERDLGHPQAMGILGFLAGALKPPL